MEGIEVDNLTKYFEDKTGNYRTILNEISFTLYPNECISIVGESGSGKSTILKILLGLLKPDKGDIKLDGESIINYTQKDWLEKRLLVQGVFQDVQGSLNEYLSTYENIEEALRNLTLKNKNERRQIVKELMAQLCVPHSLLKTPVKMLSGGEQRRISLIRALAVKPKYLLLDEVISGLDSISCSRVLDTLEEYKKQFGCAYLFITHDLNCAYRLSDRIIHMETGHITKIAVKNKKEEK